MAQFFLYDWNDGLKENPDDTRYIKKLHQNKIRRTIIGTVLKCRCAKLEGTKRGIKYPNKRRLQPGLKLWFPQTQGGVQSFWT